MFMFSSNEVCLLCLPFSPPPGVSCPQAHEVLCLEMLTLLLERPTDDSVEVSIAFLKECGLKLTEVSPRGINGSYNCQPFITIVLIVRNCD